MDSSKTIEHDGFIEEISESGIKVLILSQSACVSCQAKGACNVSDVENKVIDVPYSSEYKKGDKVNVIMTSQTGFKALFLGYVLPFLILFATLITSITITDDELFSGLLSLGILAPYYFILYLLRDKIRDNFSFQIRKL